MTRAEQTAKLTLKLAAKQNVYATKYLHGLGNGGAALPHGAGIAADAAYAVLPAFAVLAVALAFVDELPEFGAPLLILDLDGG